MSFSQTQNTELPEHSTPGRPTVDELENMTDKDQKLKTHHSQLREAHAALTAKHNEARDQIMHSVGEQKETGQEVARLHKQIDELKCQLHESQRARQAEETEANKQRQHVIALKRSIVASAKMTDQITDDDVRQKMDTVFYLVQDFAAKALSLIHI